MTFAEFCEEIYGEPLNSFQKEICDFVEKNNGKFTINVTRSRSSLHLLELAYLCNLYEEGRQNRCLEFQSQ